MSHPTIVGSDGPDGTDDEATPPRSARKDRGRGVECSCCKELVEENSKKWNGFPLCCACDAGRRAKFLAWGNDQELIDADSTTMSTDLPAWAASMLPWKDKSNRGAMRRQAKTQVKRKHEQGVKKDKLKVKKRLPFSKWGFKRMRWAKKGVASSEASEDYHRRHQNSPHYDASDESYVMVSEEEEHDVRGTYDRKGSVAETWDSDGSEGGGRRRGRARQRSRTPPRRAREAGGGDEARSEATAASSRVRRASAGSTRGEPARSSREGAGDAPGSRPEAKSEPRVRREARSRRGEEEEGPRKRRRRTVEAPAWFTKTTEVEARCKTLVGALAKKNGLLVKITELHEEFQANPQRPAGVQEFITKLKDINTNAEKFRGEAKNATEQTIDSLSVSVDGLEKEMKLIEEEAAKPHFLARGIEGEVSKREARGVLFGLLQGAQAQPLHEQEIEVE